MKLRFAGEKDIPALLDIYGQYIPTSVTFEYELPSQEEFSRRLTSFSAVYPFLTAEEDGNVLGYAYAHRCAERAAYGWGAELSVYLRPEAAGKGLGRRLSGDQPQPRQRGAAQQPQLPSHGRPAKRRL